MGTLSGSTVQDTAVPGTITNVGWAIWVLQDGGWPVTVNNVNNILAWMAAENAPTTWTGTAGANNPLNNGLGSGGGDGTGSYPDLATAAAEAAKGLQGGISGTGPAAAALANNAPFSVFQAAIIKSGWASSHYAGSGFASETTAATVPIVTAVDSAKAAGKAASLGTNSGEGDVIQGAATAGVTAEKATLGWAEELGTLLGDLTSAEWWERVGLFAAGAVLVGVGIAVFISTTKTGQKVESDAAVAALA
jgi:hypothetical protein